MARFTIPDGWTVQAFQFALDCAEQEACLRRQFGGRRYARNWAVRVLKEDRARYRETGEQTEAPSVAGLRKRWNQVKDSECVDAGTGEAWWPQISKEAFGDGIKAAVDAYWNWQSSRAGTRWGRRAGFPRAGRGRDAAAKGLTGARARRRGRSDSALGETRRQLAYKTAWYGSRLVIADRWYPSSKTCHACGHVQDIGWDEHWTCTGCGTSHQRDDNAAINLARYEEPHPGDSALGPVRATVKRGAGRKTRPRRAGGDETRTGPSRQAGKQPRDGVLMGGSP
jgi:transposase